jgi:DNA-binding LacI/PurR family transcriptional regulator
MEVRLNDERINLLREIEFPFSMIGRCTDTTGIDYVDIDFERTIQETVDYLAGLGHTKIAFLNQSQSAYDNGYGPVFRSQAAFPKAIQSAGLKGISRFCRPASQAGYEECNELFAQSPDLTALITMNERAVPGIMRAIAEQGWRIPDDFSLVVIVSSPRMAEMMNPALTSSDIAAAELSRLSVELLIQQLEAKEREPLQKLIPCRLVIRGSTGACLRNVGKSMSMPFVVEGDKIPKA